MTFHSFLPFFICLHTIPCYFYNNKWNYYTKNYISCPLIICRIIFFHLVWDVFCYIYLHMCFIHTKVDCTYHLDKIIKTENNFLTLYMCELQLDGLLSYTNMYVYVNAHGCLAFPLLFFISISYFILYIFFYYFFPS